MIFETEVHGVTKPAGKARVWKCEVAMQGASPDVAGCGWGLAWFTSQIQFAPRFAPRFEVEGEGWSPRNQRIPNPDDERYHIVIDKETEMAVQSEAMRRVT